MSKKQYRYRSEVGATRCVRPKFVKCGRLGTILEIKGYRYRHDCITQERVMVTGTHGTARFDALCWGYSGEGPRGLKDLLMFLGVTNTLAEEVAFRSYRNPNNTPGIDWTLTLKRVGPRSRQAWYVNGDNDPVCYTDQVSDNPPVNLVAAA